MKRKQTHKLAHCPLKRLPRGLWRKNWAAGHWREVLGARRLWELGFLGVRPGPGPDPHPPAPTLPSLAFPRPPLSRPDIQYLPLPGGWGGGGGTRKVLWSPEIKE